MSQEMLSFKAMNGQMGVDEALGIVECVVAVIGNKDSVGDVIIPGAFDRSFKRRKPRVVWGHDWNQPIGKVLEIYEVQPGDPRLPAKVKNLGLGAVYARVQFNLKSERGREAFSSVLFFGEEQEWSIGYKTLDAVFDPKMQANILKELELYEVSPVLHGANQLTSTLSIKDAKEAKSDDTTSFRASKWETFDRAWAERLRTEHPEIWRLGGNIKGNAQFAILSKILDDNGGSAKTPDQIAALNLREAWVARHHKDFRIAGVVAQIKWLAVGSRGEAYMKDLVNEEIKKRSTKSDVPYEDGDDEDMFYDDVFGTDGIGFKYGNKPGNSQIENLVSLVPGGDRVQSRLPGQRGGNLATLLRYWRKIMVQEGGFRRCRVILADHPELYPLNNICAWLHHETTGLWPNQGCHHPGMKNCRRKLKKLAKKPSAPSLWSEEEFANRLESRFKPNIPGKSLEMTDEDIPKMGASWSDQTDAEEGDDGRDFDETDYKVFAEMLKSWFADNPDEADWIRNDSNWVHEGDDHEGNVHEHQWLVPGYDDPDQGCDCGSKSLTGEIEEKAGRVISTRNMEKLRQAHELITEVISVGDPMGNVQTKTDGETVVIGFADTDEAVRMLTPVARYHGFSVSVDDDLNVVVKSVMTEEAMDAVSNVVRSIVGSSVEVKSVDERAFSVIEPVIRYHRVPYSVKNGVVDIAVSGSSSEANDAIEFVLRGLGG